MKPSSKKIAYVILFLEKMNFSPEEWNLFFEIMLEMENFKRSLEKTKKN